MEKKKDFIQTQKKPSAFEPANIDRQEENERPSVDQVTLPIYQFVIEDILKIKGLKKQIKFLKNKIFEKHDNWFIVSCS